MRVESVTAHAFGPFTGETLNLAPGMTVVVGDNESGKSTWHAAIYAALCGRRRGKGRAPKDEERFMELHRPWEGDQWLVSGVVCLDDERRIELRQDLAGKVDCRATDLTLGRDVSGEVTYEGSLDAARWLGLDRRSFAATACVYQAQLLGVLEGADGLQKNLERAAATAGADTTATEALGHLETFRSEHVGRDDARSARPLRQAITGLDEARKTLAQAQAAHAEYLEAVEEVDRLRRASEDHDRRVGLFEAAAAYQRAKDLRIRYDRVVALEGTFAGTAPLRPTHLDALAATVTRALDAWRDRPDPVVLDGPSAADIEHEIAGLPAAPDGPLAVPAEIRHAYDELTRAEQVLAAHDAARPSLPETSLPAVGTAELLELAQALEQNPAAVDSDTEERTKALTARLGALQARNRRSTSLIAGGVILTAAGVTGATIGPRLTWLVALVGVVIVALGALSRQSRNLVAAQGELSQLQARNDATREGAERTAEMRKEAEVRCEELGIVAVPASLRALVGDVARRDTYQEHMGAWERRRTELLRSAEDAAQRLKSALAAVGEPAGDDTLAAFAEFDDRCRQRALISEQAAKRPALQAQLRERKRSEEMAQNVASSREAATRQLLEAAQSCGLPTLSAEGAEAGLAGWERYRQGELHKFETRQEQWAELQALLGGKSLDELAETLAAAEKDSQDTQRGFRHDEIASLADQDVAAQLPALRATAETARTHAATAAGALGEKARDLTAVADAEEAAARAEAELARVRELDETLRAAADFLTKAQQGVQRDIAPLLAATLSRWLPKITAGRYVDAVVDPATLQVKVCGPNRRWYRADRLSHGTAEQVYLLLRVTLSRHLTANRGVCPLLLDDVTVQADATRTVEILDLLHELSTQQQVVLFTQETAVSQWAQRNLHQPLDAIRQLPVLNGG